MHYIRSFLITGLLAPLPFGASIPLSTPLLETAPDLPYTWDYKGCFIDRVGNRVLKRAATSDVEMTGGLCARWCAEQGFNLAGTEWGRECFCGFELNRPVQTRDADCSMPCSGWTGEACGGSQRITVYETLSGNPPATNPGVPGFPSLGCYSDSVARRALPIKAGYEGGLDVAKCATVCASQGFALAGVEYGYECYCGNALENGSHLIPGDGSVSGCDYVCSGAPAEFCGGSNRMNLYGALPAIIPTSTPHTTSTTTPTPTSTPSTTPVTTPATTPQPTPEVLPSTTGTTPIVSPVVDNTPVVQVPTSESPAPLALTPTPVNDTAAVVIPSSSTPSPSPTPSSAMDLVPVNPVIAAAV